MNRRAVMCGLLAVLYASVLGGCDTYKPPRAMTPAEVSIDIRAVDGATGRSLGDEELRAWRSSTLQGKRGGANAVRIVTASDGHARVAIAPGMYTCVEPVTGAVETTGTWLGVDHAGGPVQVFTPGAEPESTMVASGNVVDVRVWKKPAGMTVVVIPARYVGKVVVENDGTNAKAAVGADGVVHVAQSETARTMSFEDERGQPLPLVLATSNPAEVALRAVEIAESRGSGEWTVLFVGTASDGAHVKELVREAAAARGLSIKEIWREIRNEELGIGHAAHPPLSDQPRN